MIKAIKVSRALKAQLEPLVLKALKVSKEHKALLEQLELRAIKETLVPQVLKE